ncbi:MAG: hypothetical protein BroJett018_26030 [Chloroflexota bacterium]|nr:MAG: hypothetical protein BroJett018_26030 [Chloroflexota bacterium]
MSKRIFKTSVITIVVVSIIAIGVASVSAQGPGGNNGRGRNGGNGAGMGGQYGYGGSGVQNGMGMIGTNLPPAVPGEVPQEVIDTMTAGMMDEYNAYAVYQAVIDQFGAVRPFVNIQRAESQHIAAWEFIFERYGIALPEVPALDPVPQFATLAEACQLAADAEVANFDLYDTMLVTLADYPDMVQVVTALRNASELGHLPAFERCASWQ